MKKAGKFFLALILSVSMLLMFTSCADLFKTTGDLIINNDCGYSITHVEIRPLGSSTKTYSQSVSIPDGGSMNFELEPGGYDVFAEISYYELYSWTQISIVKKEVKNLTLGVTGFDGNDWYY